MEDIEDYPSSELRRLTSDDRRYIRSNQENMTQRDLADKFDVSYSVIWDVINSQESNNG